MRPSTFWTATGREVDLLEPDPAQISLGDIAKSLSRQCRFAGHLAHGVEHYSVAQHSVLVADLCAPEHALIALLHDASEAYLQDVIRPLKGILGEPYRLLEHRWNVAIAVAFDLERDALTALPPDVKEADERALVIERRSVAAVRWVEAPPPHWRGLPGLPALLGMSPLAAEVAYLERFYKAFGRPVT